MLMSPPRLGARVVAPTVQRAGHRTGHRGDGFGRETCRPVGVGVDMPAPDPAGGGTAKPPAGVAPRSSHHRLVDEAPAPVLSGLEGLNDRMPALVEVLAGVPVRRRVAASDVAAREAEPEMHPLAADA